MEKVKLSQGQRSLLKLIYQMVSANPFGAEILTLEKELGNGQTGLTGEELSLMYIDKIDKFFSNIDKQLGRPAKLSDFEESYRHEVFYMICCRLFNKNMVKFDDQTERQLSQPDKQLSVDFADDMVREMLVRGIDNAGIDRAMGYMYQMRRAWWFISKRLAGKGESMNQLRQDLWNNIFTHSIEIYEKTLWYRMEDFSTLLLGPTGSGKGAAASAIGFSSYIPYDVNRRRFAESFVKNFVSVNLSQYPETLLESEIFGHARGAFTGAIDQYDGVLSRCSQYGTIFLDEIGELKQHTQVKLLKVLEERSYSRLGSHDKLRFQGRVLAATHRPIDRLCREDGFREDLYYRLCSDVIYVPSLRQRLDESAEELTILVEHLLTLFLGHADAELAAMITERISAEMPSDHPWPGNVRELAQMVRRVILRKSCGKLTELAAGAATLMPDTGTECTIAELTESYCKKLYDKYGSYSIVANITGLDWRTVKRSLKA